MSKSALGGAIRTAVGRAKNAQVQQAPPAKGGLRGALGRVVGRIAPQTQKNPQPVKGNHMMRNAGPIKQGLLSGTDSTIAETGDGLRKVVGRIASRGRVAAAKGGKIQKYADGGKVGTAMSALRMLAKKYQAAIESGDTMLARRLKKQMDSAGVEDPEVAVGQEKAKTFAKGGKVKAVAAGVAAARDRTRRLKEILSRDFRKAKKMKDDEPVRVKFGKNEDTHVIARGKKYSFKAGSDDDRYDFRSEDGEHVPVEFSDDLLKTGDE